MTHQYNYKHRYKRGASRVKSVSKWSNPSMMPWPCSCIFQWECILAIMARTQIESAQTYSYS